MAKIELEITVEKLLGFAAEATEDGKYMLAIQNLNEAFGLATESEEKKRIYLAYADVFLITGNDPMARYCLFMANKIGGENRHFNLFDFSRFFPEEPLTVVAAEEELEPLSAAEVCRFNEVYGLVAEKKYGEALKKMMTLPLNRKNMSSIVDILNMAVELDPTFDLDAFFVGLLPLIGTYASGDSEFINLLLEGGENLKELAVQSAVYFADENEDVNILRDIGEVYFLAREYQSAKLFFDKVLSLCEIDEVALYYEAAICSAEKDKQKASEYRAKYFAVCKIGLPPMRLIDRCIDGMAAADAPNSYLTLSVSEEQNMDTFFQSIDFAEEPDEETFLTVRNYFCFSQTFFCAQFLDRLADKAKVKEKWFGLLTSLTCSPFASREIKLSVLRALIRMGYEGELSFTTPERAVTFVCAQAHHRFYGAWYSAYGEMIVRFLTADFYIPVYCNVLASAIKKCQETFYYTPFEEDKPFAMLIAACTYMRKINVNVGLREIFGLFGLDYSEVDQCMKKFRLDTLFL